MAAILLVDDDQNNLNAMWRVLHLNTDYEVERFTEPQQALARAAEREFDLVVADYRMPGMDGAKFFQEFRRIQPLAYRVIVSGFSDVELFRAAINTAQIQHFLQKPCDGLLLLQVINEGLAQVNLSRQVEELTARLGQTQELLESRTQLLRSVAEKQPGLLPKDWE